ncbi:hypothetical protein SLA2020_231260 [Shorea laevis]
MMVSPGEKTIFSVSTTMRSCIRFPNLNPKFKRFYLSLLHNPIHLEERTQHVSYTGAVHQNSSDMMKSYLSFSVALQQL